MAIPAVAHQHFVHTDNKPTASNDQILWMAPRMGGDVKGRIFLGVI